MGHGVILILVVAIAVGLGSVAVTFRLQSLYRRPPLTHLFMFLVTINVAAVLAVFYNYVVENLVADLTPTASMAVEIAYRGAAMVLLLFVFGSVILLARAMVGEQLSATYRTVLLSGWGALAVLFVLGVVLDWRIGGLPVPLAANLVLDQGGQWLGLVEIVRASVLTSNLTDRVHRRLSRVLLGILGALWCTIIVLSMAALLGWIEGSTLNLCAAVSFVLLNGLPLVFLQRFVERLYGPLDPMASAPSGGSLLDDLAVRYGISPREREVVELICRGHSNKEIAALLSISVATVKDHNHNVFKKTGVQSRTQLMALLKGPS